MNLASRSYRAHPVRRDAEFQSLDSLTSGGNRRREAQKQGGGGGLTIGGLTLGGSGSGITGNGLKLGGTEQGNNTATTAEVPKSSAADDEAPAAVENLPAVEDGKSAVAIEQELKETAASAGAGTENQPGRAEGEAARTEAEKENPNGVKATEESEKFSEESGITLGEDGAAANLGGNLGITQGSDGSKSIGGSNGINIAANGEATLAGNER